MSALTGAGVETLRSHLKECVGYATPGTGTLSARRRHLDALRIARTHVESAERLLLERRDGGLVAQELTDAQRALGGITGEVTSEDLLGRTSPASASESKKKDIPLRLTRSGAARYPLI